MYPPRKPYNQCDIAVVHRVKELQTLCFRRLFLRSRGSQFKRECYFFLNLLWRTNSWRTDKTSQRQRSEIGSRKGRNKLTLRTVLWAISTNIKEDLGTPPHAVMQAVRTDWYKARYTILMSWLSAMLERPLKINNNFRVLAKSKSMYRLKLGYLSIITPR